MSPKKKVFKDPRFIIGILLIIGSVALGSWSVDRAVRGVEVVRVATDLAAGVSPTEKDLEIVEVSLGAVNGKYVLAGQLPKKWVLTRPVSAGELIPKTAVGEPDKKGTSQLMVTLLSALPDTVKVGDTIDLWSLPVKDFSTEKAPVKVAEGATLVKIRGNENAVGPTSHEIEVIVLNKQVEPLFKAISRGDRIMPVQVKK